MRAHVRRLLPAEQDGATAVGAGASVGENCRSGPSEWKSKRAPLVLKYEDEKKGKKDSAKAKRMVTPSMSSTLATVKDFMAKQKQDSDPQDSVFSIFRQQPPKKSS